MDGRFLSIGSTRRCGRAGTGVPGKNHRPYQNIRAAADGADCAPAELFKMLFHTTREVFPELLDTLPHDDAAARRSRGELRMINGVMGNHRWLRRRLREPQFRGHRVLELGAGDGAFARRVWREGITHPAQWTALDLAPEPKEWPREARWQQRDLFTLSVLPEAEIVVANLFLHHLQDRQLAALGRLLPVACRTFLACEPARRCAHVLQGRVLSALAGLSEVTHHDMFVSIRAGFVSDELPDALGLRDWQTRVSLTALGAYRLVA